MFVGLYLATLSLRYVIGFTTFIYLRKLLTIEQYTVICSYFSWCVSGGGDKAERREWIKPIMFSGGLGTLDAVMVKKLPPQKGVLNETLCSVTAYICSCIVKPWKEPCYLRF